MIGKTISHYRILEKLGEGGMGVVYKAWDTKLDRYVAIKFLSLHLTTSEDAKKRFVREAKAASALDHPNINTIYEIDELPDRRMFIAMAYYDGEDLRQRLEKGPLDTDEAIDLVLQVADGLSKAHENDIVHRDIKPANLIVTKDGRAKIVDFGLAKFTDRTKITRTGSAPGTVAYMSPEQLTGEEADARSDIFSLGVVLYELLAQPALE
jgi:serine/threonine protein kinase